MSENWRDNTRSGSSLHSEQRSITMIVIVIRCCVTLHSSLDYMLSKITQWAGVMPSLWRSVFIVVVYRDFRVKRENHWRKITYN